MKDSEIVSKLIFLAFIAAQEPVQAVDDGTGMLAWSDAMGLYARCIAREAFGPSGTPAPTGGAVGPAPADHFRDVTKMIDVDEATCATLGEAIAALEDPDVFLEKEPEPEVLQVPPPIFEAKPSPLEETIPLRAKEIKAELSTVPSFKGKSATEKRETFNRMNRFRETHRTQAFKVAAEASDGKLTEWQLRDMMEGKPAPMSRWNDLAAALDRLEVL